MSLLLATIVTINLPLGPGSESFARELAAPFEHAEPIADTEWHLWDIRVQPKALLYRVAKPHEKPAAIILVDLEAAADRRDDAVRLEASDGCPEGALASSRLLMEALRANLMAETLRFKRRAPAPTDHPVDVAPDTQSSASPRAPPAGTPRWLAALLLLALASALATYRLAIGRAIVARAGTGWRLALFLSLTTGALLFWMEDVVLHPNAHGWDTIRSVAGFSETPFPLWDRYGAFVIELGRLLGLAADSGRETWVASRLAAALSVLVTYLMTLSVLKSHVIALISSGLVATSPVLLFSGRGEALSTSGVLLTCLSAWLFALAARRRIVPLLACGAIALACLANFRLMGPIMAPCVGLFALLPSEAPVDARDERRWRVLALAAWAGAAIVATPHLLRMGWLMGAELGVRPEANVIPRTLLDSPMWTPFALFAMAAWGLLWLARTQPFVALLSGLWLAGALVGPATSSAFYQDQARYQVFALPALALCAAAGLSAVRAWPRRVAAPLVVAWLIWFGLGQQLAGEVMATDQAEATQLRAWRAAAEALPTGAWLAVPVDTQGRARTALPDVELLARRPDVRLVSLQEAERAADAPVFWFEGLSCFARYPADPEDPARDCRAARSQAYLTPRIRWRVDPELPESLARRVRSPRASLSPLAGDPGQWNPRPFVRDPLVIGLYQLAWRTPPVSHPGKSLDEGDTNP